MINKCNHLYYFYYKHFHAVLQAIWLGEVVALDAMMGA